MDVLVPLNLHEVAELGIKCKEFSFESMNLEVVGREKQWFCRDLCLGSSCS